MAALFPLHRSGKLRSSLPLACSPSSHDANAGASRPSHVALHRNLRVPSPLARSRVARSALDTPFALAATAQGPNDHRGIHTNRLRLLRIPRPAVAAHRPVPRRTRECRRRRHERSRSSTTSATPAAACGRPRTPARRGATSPTATSSTGSVGAIAVAPVRPERDLRRDGRARDSRADVVVRRRRLPQHRRRARRGRTSGSRPRGRSRPCASTRRIPTWCTSPRRATMEGNAERGDLPLDRWRQDLDAGAQGRERDERRERSLDGPDEPAHPLRRVLGSSARAVGGAKRRARQRHLEVDRRRRHVDAPDAKACRS